jgi:hypothetical protein
MECAEKSDANHHTGELTFIQLTLKEFVVHEWSVKDGGFEDRRFAQFVAYGLRLSRGKVEDS